MWLESPPTLAQVRAGKQKTDCAEIESFYSTHGKGAADAVRFMTYDEILATFGPPTEMRRDGVWVYMCSLEGGALEILMQFRNGYVAESGWY